jgi:spore germination cell wall hydrolase CwlJ-like protein
MTSIEAVAVSNLHSSDKAISRALGLAVMIILMIGAIWASASLLNWALDEKLAGIKPVVNNQITAEYRERQLVCLAKNIYHEAGSEPFEGKVAVAQVTLNRAGDRGFPDDVCAVIYQKNKIYDSVICQFSWVCNSANSVKVTNNAAYTESMAVAKKVLLEGFRLPSLEKALYFHGDYINPGWKRTKVAHIGRHIFYK